MALQVDVIPGTGSPYFTTNIEDGIALADETSRAEFEHKYPKYGGAFRHGGFVHDGLEIYLESEVLPFSDSPAYLTPYLPSPHKGMRVVGGGGSLLTQYTYWVYIENGFR